MVKILFAFGLLTCVAVAQAKPAFTGINFSGRYDCKGNNELVGDYQVTVKFKLNRISSFGKFGAYDFSTETDNAVTYRGQAVANGFRLALSYKLTEGKYVEYTTGIAEMKKLSRGRWSFRNLYYEPDDNGGNYGQEDCVMQLSSVIKPASKPTKSKQKS
ncbi:MAG: hypothetical protein B7X95_09960 [Methylophilaceae bacterium 17-44-8]|nr:MAG: hypothetical protein B7Y48_04945 [Methylophilales bacterium 28-44-11]OYY90846.1 MAG: hypothetical protein B7Y32_09060 [Methylophilales bacterium 16-45-7]OZA04510.1 MAG: hypothetical protein B7X95_09960 [Methylophilaceae bacterium 17-44-8]